MNTIEQMFTTAERNLEIHEHYRTKAHHCRKKSWDSWTL